MFYYLICLSQSSVEEGGRSIYIQTYKTTRLCYQHCQYSRPIILDEKQFGGAQERGNSKELRGVHITYINSLKLLLGIRSLYDSWNSQQTCVLRKTANRTRVVVRIRTESGSVTLSGWTRVKTCVIQCSSECNTAEWRVLVWVSELFHVQTAVLE